MSTKGVEVRPGQIWKDNDKRGPDRFLRVIRLDMDGFGAGFAICQPVFRDTRGNWNNLPRREARIAVRRMKPTATGYKLIEETT